LKKKACAVLLFTLFVGCFADDTYRQGVHLGIGFSPSFSYLLTSTESAGSQAVWYSNYLGGMSAEARVGWSKSEQKTSSFVSSLTWDYPSSHFAYSLFNGYAFTYYLNETAPSKVFDFFGGLFYSNVAGLSNISGAWGTKIGAKAGYEFNKHLTFWVGCSIAGQIRSYSILATQISDAYEIMPIGTYSSRELIFPTSILCSFSYSFF